MTLPTLPTADCTAINCVNQLATPSGLEFWAGGGPPPLLKPDGRRSINNKSIYTA